ncbi:hypothetical protein HOK68_01885 [Candidatus Woesearchaeota archaeon]|jgi:aminopeptidase|nr:hypothetical protein [Candidatus Woesearchaeota archaeon]MBT4388021.1 hypothetical protein [Candidatus Woesearchaeota archaeon]MBT4596286.1 hypothetical protein [Candidatus Woesearchaeota archaeon]MBT5740788.1 hypothetical protein [Candidatus Woesearchaeota archaeon]MBT6505511.1 hypothetical protein [Candidatus Woesearchaeota archaeon]
MNILEKAQVNCKNIIEKNLNIDKNQNVILIYDDKCDLSKLLFKSYSNVLKEYNLKSIKFDETKQDELKEFLYNLNKGDYVILIQSGSFRLSNYRIRLDLNNRGIFVIEHARLSFFNNIESYINSLTYDFDRYKKISNYITNEIKNTNQIKIISNDGSELIYEGGFEDAKSNIGDFSNKLGSLFPIGEVFSEPKKLESVNGTISIIGIPSLEHKTIFVSPFKVNIKNGTIIGQDGNKDFEKIINLIKSENEDGIVWIREMGFGMNKNISKENPLEDISAHERYCGYHISLGLKHNIYRKKIDKKVNQKFHIDIFCDLKEIWFDDKIIFKKKDYVIF